MLIRYWSVDAQDVARVFSSPASTRGRGCSGRQRAPRRAARPAEAPARRAIRSRTGSLAITLPSSTARFVRPSRLYVSWRRSSSADVGRVDDHVRGRRRHLERARLQLGRGEADLLHAPARPRATRAGGSRRRRHAGARGCGGAVRDPWSATNGRAAPRTSGAQVALRPQPFIWRRGAPPRPQRRHRHVQRPRQWRSPRCARPRPRSARSAPSGSSWTTARGRHRRRDRARVPGRARVPRSQPRLRRRQQRRAAACAAAATCCC